jgi:putative phage-type endonuclease
MAAPILLCDTKGMSRERWLECREHGPKGDIDFTVGGSDVAVIFGVSPWMTPLELWRIKKGLMKVPAFANEEQMAMGHMLEPIAAHWYAKRTGNTVSEDTGMYQHADHPYALANFDRRFSEPSGANGILECKSTTYHKASDWYDEAIPVFYEFQLRFYLAVADVDIGDFACLWGNNPNNDLATPRVTRDKFKEDVIFEKLEEWIWSLKNDKPPTMADVEPKLALESLARIYGASQNGLPTIEFSKKQEHALRRIALLQTENTELNRAIQQNEKEIDAHSVRIAEIMKEHEHGVLETTSDRLLIDFVTKITRRVNSDRLKQSHPIIYQDCLRASESRKVKVKIETIAV